MYQDATTLCYLWRQGTKLAHPYRYRAAPQCFVGKSIHYSQPKASKNGVTATREAHCTNCVSSRHCRKEGGRPGKSLLACQAGSHTDGVRTTCLHPGTITALCRHTSTESACQFKRLQDQSYSHIHWLLTEEQSPEKGCHNINTRVWLCCHL